MTLVLQQARRFLSEYRACGADRHRGGAPLSGSTTVPQLISDHDPSLELFLARRFYGPAAFDIRPLLAQSVTPSQGSRSPSGRSYRAVADSLIRAATSDSAAYQRLGKLVDTFGHRLSGSASLEAAISWILGEMKSDGLQNVRGEPVMVPHWVRGEESATLRKPRMSPLRMLGLGGSISTPKAGITAPVLVVTSFDDLRRRAAEARGKDRAVRCAVHHLSRDGALSGRGASAAAKAGAVACLIRSVASFSIRSPHTGVMHYDSTAGQDPDRGAQCGGRDDAAPLSGSGRAGGGHAANGRAHRCRTRRRGTSWPRSSGGSGPTKSWCWEDTSIPGMWVRAPWTMAAERWRRGRRSGSFTGWDFGRGVRSGWCSGPTRKTAARGALAYRDTHADQLGKHVLAMESDNGAFTPHGFRFSGSDAAFATAQQVGALLQPIGAGSVSRETGFAGGRHRAAGGAGDTRRGPGCGPDPLLLVSSQRRRHSGQARPGGASPLCGGHGGDGLCRCRSTDPLPRPPTPRDPET